MRFLPLAPTAVGAMLLAGCSTQPEFLGPLPVRNQHPAQLTVLHMPPAATTSLEPGAVAARADFAYTSLFLSGATGGGNSFRMDGEYLRAATQLRVGLGAGFEASLELPVAHTSGGFLDSFLIDYHDFFGLPDQERNESAKNEFTIAARQAGQTAWSVEPSGLELLDVPIGLSWNAVEVRDGLGVTLRSAVELPTGAASHGYGNGEVDWSAGVLLETHAVGAAWYGHLQHTLAGSPSTARAAGLKFADVTSLGLGAEVPLHQRLNAFAQLEWESSTLRNLAVPEAQHDQLLLWCGGRWRAGPRWAIEIGFGEDLRSLASPDFTAWLGFTTVPALPAANPAGAR